MLVQTTDSEYKFLNCGIDVDIALVTDTIQSDFTAYYLLIYSFVSV